MPRKELLASDWSNKQVILLIGVLQIIRIPWKQAMCSAEKKNRADNQRGEMVQGYESGEGR